ncbi:MAG: DUF421 domain-containing protein [Firmicutes bacterium]|nr:DUF421 domain-containing protein [Bacillota bacterium]
MDRWIIILIRSFSLLVICYALMRIMGKRNGAQSTPFTFIYLSVISFIAAAISLNIIGNLALGLVALLVWFVVPLLVEYISIKSKLVHDLYYGKEIVLINQGKIMEENLLQARLTGDELLHDLRSKNVFNLADVEFAVLEVDGEVNVFLKSDRKPITPKDMDLQVSLKAQPQTIIMDGNIIYESLANLGLNQQWLNQQLSSKGVSLDNVFLCQTDSSGDLYIDLFDDSINLPQANLKEMLLANLEKIQSELEIYSIQTENSDAKSMYKKNAEKLNEIIKMLKPYLN